MAGKFNVDYGVDLVFCIDVTMSMDHILNTVKENALNFYKDFMDCMFQKNKHVSQVRVRLVAFRDYRADKEDAMLVTDFFTLPQQAADFRACMDCITAGGGGDDEEDGLEALGYAIKSDWSTTAAKKRHVIILWSDDDTHALGYGRNVRNYPRGMARNFDELTDWWGCRSSHGIMDEAAKRLILFAPGHTKNTDYTNWARISDSWNKVIQYDCSDAGKGLRTVDYTAILNAISNSI